MTESAVFLWCSEVTRTHTPPHVRCGLPLSLTWKPRPQAGDRLPEGASLLSPNLQPQSCPGASRNRARAASGDCAAPKVAVGPRPPPRPPFRTSQLANCSLPRAAGRAPAPSRSPASTAAPPPHPPLPLSPPVLTSPAHRLREPSVRELAPGTQHCPA